MKTMEKITKTEVDELVAKSDSVVTNLNDGNLRERWILHIDNRFICIEGNTNGWYMDKNKTFSHSIRWMNQA